MSEEEEAAPILLLILRKSIGKEKAKKPLPRFKFRKDSTTYIKITLTNKQD